MEFATSESILISEMSYSMEQICEMPIPELNELIFKANMTQKEKLDWRKYYKINKASLKQQLNLQTFLKMKDSIPKRYLFGVRRELRIYFLECRQLQLSESHNWKQTAFSAKRQLAFSCIIAILQNTICSEH